MKTWQIGITVAGSVAAILISTFTLVRGSDQRTNETQYAACMSKAIEACTKAEQTENTVIRMDANMKAIERRLSSLEASVDHRFDKLESDQEESTQTILRAIEKSK